MRRRKWGSEYVLTAEFWARVDQTSVLRWATNSVVSTANRDAAVPIEPRDVHVFPLRYIERELPETRRERLIRWLRRRPRRVVRDVAIRVVVYGWVQA